MDINDFGKRLDAFSSNSSTSIVYLPSDVAESLQKCDYWNKETEGLWIQNPQEQDNVKRLCTSFFVTVKTDNNGLYINGNLTVRWEDTHIVNEETLLYKTIGGDSMLGLMKSVIVCKFSEEYLDAVIMFDVPNDVKQFIQDNAKKYLLTELGKLSYWKKGNNCAFVDKVDSGIVTCRGIIIANEEGLYISDSCILRWDDYIPFIRKEVTDGQFIFHKNELKTWGDKNCGFYPHNKMLMIGNEFICYDDKTIVIGGKTITSLYGSKFWEADDYRNRPTKSFLADPIEFCIEDSEEEKTYAKIGFRSCVVTSSIADPRILSICFRFQSFFNGEEQYTDAENPAFKDAEFILRVNHLTCHKLTLLRIIKTSDGKIPIYEYRITKKLLRIISFAESINIEINLDDFGYEFSADDLIKLAKKFDKQVYNSPKYDVDFYKAEICYEEKDYEKAYRLIKPALKAEPNNSDYVKLGKKITTKIAAVEKAAFKEVKDLLEAGKHETAYEKCGELVRLYKKPEYTQLQSEILEGWLKWLFEEAQKESSSQQYEKAIGLVKKAISLQARDEFEEFKTKTEDTFVEDLYKRASNLMNGKHWSNAIELLEKAHQIRPDNTDVQNKLKKAREKRKKGLYATLIRACIALCVVCALLFVFSQIEASRKRAEEERYRQEMALKMEEERKKQIELEQERERERAKEEAEKQRMMGVIKERIDSICWSITKCENTDRFLSNSLRQLCDKASDLETKKELYGNWIETNIWTNSQDHNAVTADLLDFEYSHSRGKRLKAKVRFIDSEWGELSVQYLHFLYENGDWFVDDIVTVKNNFSLKEFTLDFIRKFGD